MANDENIKSNCEHLHKADVMQKKPWKLKNA